MNQIILRTFPLLILTTFLSLTTSSFAQTRLTTVYPSPEGRYDRLVVDELVIRNVITFDGSTRHSDCSINHTYDTKVLSLQYGTNHTITSCFDGGPVGVGMWTGGFNLIYPEYYNSSSLKIGLRTASPRHLLHLLPNVPTVTPENVAAKILALSSGSTGNYYGFSVTPYGVGIHANSTFDANPALIVNSSNVGIGVTAPSTALEVEGTAKINHDLNVGNTTRVSSITLHGNLSAHGWNAANLGFSDNLLAGRYFMGIRGLSENGAAPFKFFYYSNSAGNSWQNVWTIQPSALNSPSYGFGIKNTGTGYSLFVDAANNVGIHNSTPTQRLDVVGNIVASGYNASTPAVIQGNITATRTLTGTAIKIPTGNPQSRGITQEDGMMWLEP